MSDELSKGKQNLMEKKIDGKRKSVASIPANYVSILQLQERWMKEKERKQKERDFVERGVKQQVNGQPRREEAMKPRVKLEEQGLLGAGFRMNRGKKEPTFIEKEEVEVSATVSKEEEDGGDSRERKKKWSQKVNKSQGWSVVKDARCGSKARENDPVGENAARVSIAQFQDLTITKRVQEEEGREAKGPARLNSRQSYYRNQKHETRTMVWVKKGNAV